MNASPNGNKGFFVSTSYTRITGITKQGFRNSLLALGLAATVAPAAHAYTPTLNPSVTTAGGTFSQLQGVNGSYNTLAFLGVPFAKPPTGSLRWRAPQDPAWFAAGTYGSSFRSQCAQIGNFFDGVGDKNNFPKAGFAGNLVGDENCLYLNVWRPNNTNENLPVVVWIHGGSNFKGTAKDKTFDGARFASRNNVVVVSVQYRLGLFGWLYQSAIQTPNASTDYDKQSNSGNFAQLDLIKSLNWVQANAATFGGNKYNVTIVGESAGCINVWGMVQSPLAANKFHKAICMSAFPNANDTQSQGQATADGLVNKLLMEKYGETWAQADARRKLMPASDIKTLLYAATPFQVMKYTPHPYVPGHFTDGVVMPAKVAGLPAMFACNYNKVPMIFGTTRDEGSYFVRVADPLQASGDKSFVPDDPTLWDMINSGSTSYTQSDLITSSFRDVAWIANPFPTSYGWLVPPLQKFKLTELTITAGIDYTIDNVMRYLSAQVLCSPPTFYRYNFNWANTPEPWKSVFASSHAMDVPFLFGNFVTGSPDFFRFAWSSGNFTERENLSALMNQYFKNFVHSSGTNLGNPNSSSVPIQWSPWNNDTGLIRRNKRMIFNYSGSTNTSSSSNDNYFHFTTDYAYMNTAAITFPYFWDEAVTAINAALIVSSLPPEVNPYTSQYRE